MNPALYIVIFLPIFIAIVQFNRSRRIIFYKKAKERRIKNMAISNDLIKELINEKCIVSTGSWGTSYNGIIKAVEDNWLKIDTGKKTVILSLDYITSIEQKNS